MLFGLWKKFFSSIINNLQHNNLRNKTFLLLLLQRKYNILKMGLYWEYIYLLKILFIDIYLFIKNKYIHV